MKYELIKEGDLYRIKALEKLSNIADRYDEDEE